MASLDVVIAPPPVVVDVDARVVVVVEGVVLSAPRA